MREPTTTRRSRRPTVAAATICLALAAVSLAACGGDWEAVGYERGDTTVVRTVAGSVWGQPATLVEKARVAPNPDDSAFAFDAVAALAVGRRGEVYVVDPRTPAVRVYKKNAKYVRAIGGKGPGPGFYSFPNGVAVLPDGRVVVRDPRRSQLVLYSRQGDYLERWPHPSGVYEPLPLMLDADGRLYTRMVYNPSDPREDWDRGFVRYSTDGTTQDTIPDPTIDFEPLAVAVETTDGEEVRFAIPLTARAYWALGYHGEVIRAISDRYAMDVVRPGGSVVRIEREFEPAPATREERAALYRRVDRLARQIDYQWTWGGPVIPDVKPPFKELFVDQDGRIWVRLHQPVEPVTPEALGASEADTLDASDESAAEGVEVTRTSPGGGSLTWREPIVFDVFEPGGRYLGQVHAPSGFRTLPQPVIRGDMVWAVVAEPDELPNVVRFRIDR